MALDDVDEKFKLTLSEFVGLLLELLDGTLVDSSALEDQVTGGGGLAGIWAKGDLSVPARGGGGTRLTDVADDDDVNVELLFSHCL